MQLSFSLSIILHVRHSESWTQAIEGEWKGSGKKGFGIVRRGSKGNSRTVRQGAEHLTLWRAIFLFTVKCFKSNSMSRIKHIQCLGAESMDTSKGFTSAYLRLYAFSLCALSHATARHVFRVSRIRYYLPDTDTRCAYLLLCNSQACTTGSTSLLDQRGVLSFAGVCVSLDWRTGNSGRICVDARSTCVDGWLQ